MSELERLVLEHGTYWFELVGGADWQSDLAMGVNAVAVILPAIAAGLAAVTIARGGSE